MPRGARHAAAARQAMLEPTVETEEEAAAAAFDAGEGDDDGEAVDPFEELSDLLRQEAEAALGRDGDSIATDQIRAFERYMGKDYGDEIDGQSRVHTREVFEVVEWLRPDMARIFAAGSGAIEVEAWEEGAEDQAEQATQFLQDMIFGPDGPGLRLVDWFFFNGAVQKLGVIGVYWQEARLGRPEEIEGVNLLQVQQLAADDSVEILGAEQTGLDEATGLGLFAVKLQRVVEPARPIMEVLPPEDFRCTAQETDLQRPFYCGCDIRMTKARIKQMWPEKKAEIDEAADGEREGASMDERRAARFELDVSGLEPRLNRKDADDVLLAREYIEHDLDGDDYPELLECWRLGDMVLEAEAVDEHCFAAWTPIAIPHRLVGLSVADTTVDLQRIQTVLTRSAMDGTMLSVAPRVAASDKVNLVDLLSVRAGGVIRMKDGAQTQSVANELYPIVTPDVANSALKMIEKFEQRQEVRTGVTRHAQGLNPDVLNKTMGGIDLLQNAAASRKEMLARNMGEGLEVAFSKYLRLCIKHMKGPQKRRIGKEWKTFEPEKWSKSARVRVHVGQGTGNRQAQLVQLNLIKGMQTEVVRTFGPANPFVTPAHLHNTAEQMVRVMGFRSADPFFTDPKEVPPAAMAPKPDPKTEVALKALEIKVQELQAKVGLKREEIASEAQLTREKTATEAQLAREENQTDAAVKLATGAGGGGPHTRVGGDKV